MADQTIKQIPRTVTAFTGAESLEGEDTTGSFQGTVSNLTKGLDAAEIKTKYEGNANTNEFNDAEKSKLAGIDASANNYTHPNHSGDVTSVGDGAQTIAANAVDNTKAADMAAYTIKMRNDPAAGDPADIDLDALSEYTALEATDVFLVKKQAGAYGKVTDKTLCNQIGSYTNVKSFGAVGDGVADDTIPIQNALDLTNVSTSRTVFFPQGTYRYVGDMALPANKRIIGNGMDNSQCRLKIEYKDALEKGRIIMDGTVSGSGGSSFQNMIQDILIEYDAKGQDCTTMTDGFLKMTGPGYNNSLINVWFYNIPTEYFCVFTHGNNTLFQNVRVWADSTTQRTGRPAQCFSISGANIPQGNFFHCDVENFVDAYRYENGQIKIDGGRIERSSNPLYINNGITWETENWLHVKGVRIQTESVNTAIRIYACHNIELNPQINQAGGVGIYIYYTGSEPLPNVHIKGVVKDYPQMVADTGMIRPPGKVHLLELDGNRYGTAAPTAGTWTQGEVIKALEPTDSVTRWVCTAGGTPGTWSAGGSVADDSVTNAKLANMAAETIKMRTTTTGDPQDLSPSDLPQETAPVDQDIVLGQKDGGALVKIPVGNLPISPTGGISLNYKWQDDTAATDPGSGNVKGNNASQSLITNLYISETTSTGNNVQPPLSTWGEGDYVSIQDNKDASRGHSYEVSGVPTDNGVWWTFPVTHIPTGSTDIADNRAVQLQIILDPNSRMPRGGATDQAMVKQSANDFDTVWANVVKSDPTGVTGADQITNSMSLTQAEYDAITPNASTLYVIV